MDHDSTRKVNGAGGFRESSTASPKNDDQTVEGRFGALAMLVGARTGSRGLGSGFPPRSPPPPLRSVPLLPWWIRSGRCGSRRCSTTRSVTGNSRTGCDCPRPSSARGRTGTLRGHRAGVRPARCALGAAAAGALPSRSWWVHPNGTPTAATGARSVRRRSPGSEGPAAAGRRGRRCPLPTGRGGRTGTIRRFLSVPPSGRGRRRR